MLRIMINIKIINQTYGLITFRATLPEVSAKKTTTPKQGFVAMSSCVCRRNTNKKTDKIFINFISILQMSIRHPQAAIE